MPKPDDEQRQPLTSTPASYDCMFVEGPNQFFTDSEGGFINASSLLAPIKLQHVQTN